MKKKNSEAGFSLVELLVVLAITSVLFAIIFWSLSFQKISTDRQTSLSDIYENQRFAMDIISRYIRVAGLNMNAERFYFLGALAGMEPIEPSNNVPGLKYTDKLKLRYLMDHGECGSLPLDEDMPKPSSEFKTSDINDCWAEMDASCPFWALIIDPAMHYMDLFIMTRIQADADHVQHAPGTALDGYTNPPSGLSHAYGSGSIILMITWEEMEIFLDFTCPSCKQVTLADGRQRPGHPRLIMRRRDGSVIPLATDVEDLQFAYALDRDTDGVLDEIDGLAGLTDGDYISNVPNADWRYIRAARISMCFRSREWTSRKAESRRPAIEDHNYDFGVPADGFSRKTISARVKIRNLDKAYTSN